VTAGWITRIRRQGVAVLICIAVWGTAVAAFGMLTGGFLVGLALLAVAGTADVYSAIFRGTIVQMSVPDHLRGRITAVNLMVVISGPRLGEVESGVVADLTTPRFSVVSGGVACLLGAALLALAVPALYRYKVDAEEAIAPPPEPN
ncbi:MAG: MFS transporter, partial [Actinomycetota bacterium]